MENLNSYNGFLNEYNHNDMEGYIPNEYTFNQVKLWVKKLVGCYVQIVTFDTKKVITVKVYKTDVFDLDVCKDGGNMQFVGHIYINGIKILNYSPIIIIRGHREE